ncbi:hypothetical protein ACWEKR_08260 [Nocardia sp. NPDC004573]|uniref:hypothetical protein n=1 Tax=Nocardia sp. NPDC047038 TaxID=3154338 RepID=UPI0033C35C21
MNDNDFRLDFIRGSVTPKKHNARTIAALTSNPGCARRSVLDAAAVDKQELAEHLGYRPQFGQSPFDLTRGKAFEAFVKDHGCTELLKLLREHLQLPLPQVAYADLNNVAGHDTLETRYTNSRQQLTRAGRSGPGAGTLFDHPLLRMNIAGHNAYLEPDLIAFKLSEQFHVVEVKSFPIIDGSANPAKVALAATQSAVYVLALRQLLQELRLDPSLVSDEVFLVCPENFSNRPTAARVDVRKQLTVLRRQLARIADIGTLLGALPPTLTLDLCRDPEGKATRSVADLCAALDAIEARYAPECLTTCEMALFCRNEAHDRTSRLGRSVQEDLGGIESITRTLHLAEGTRTPGEHEYEATQVLRMAAQLRMDCLGGVA